MIQWLTLRVAQPPREQEIEVEFPIFRRHDLDNSTIYTKRIGPQQTLDVTVYHDNDRKFTIEVDHRDDMTEDWSALDYQLGRGHYACSRHDFEMVLARALDSHQVFFDRDFNVNEEGEVE